MEPPWRTFDFAVDVAGDYERKLEALRAHEAVFSGDQGQLLDNTLLKIATSEAWWRWRRGGVQGTQPAVGQRSGSLRPFPVRLTALVLGDNS